MALETTPTTVMVRVEELNQMRANQQQIQEMLAARELEATSATLRATAVSGQFEQLARSHRQEIETERQRAASFAAKSELARSLASQPLVPGGAEQLTSIWSGQLRADPTADGFNVRTESFQDVNTFVTSQLSRPEFAHFRRDTQPTAPVNRPTQPSPETSIAEPSNLGQALIQNYHSQRQAVDASKSGIDPRLDPSQSFGLGNARGGSAFRGLLPGFGQSR
jgi:hypothetical protein